MSVSRMLSYIRIARVSIWVLHDYVPVSREYILMPNSRDTPIHVFIHDFLTIHEYMVPYMGSSWLYVLIHTCLMSDSLICILTCLSHECSTTICTDTLHTCLVYVTTICTHIYLSRVCLTTIYSRTCLSRECLTTACLFCAICSHGLCLLNVGTIYTHTSDSQLSVLMHANAFTCSYRRLAFPRAHSEMSSYVLDCSCQGLWWHWWRRTGTR